MKQNELRSTLMNIVMVRFFDVPVLIGGRSLTQNWRMMSPCSQVNLQHPLLILMATAEITSEECMRTEIVY